MGPIWDWCSILVCEEVPREHLENAVLRWPSNGRRNPPQRRAAIPRTYGGYHLPRFGRVVAVPDAPAAPGLCDDFRPRYGVDVLVLLPDGEPDPDLPILAGLPLPAPMGGQEAGLFGFPEENTTVVVCFAYGLPHKPFIQQILPHGLSLPRVPKGDQVWQHSEACQQRVDADGNWLRQTDGKIQDKAIEREVEALDNAERFQKKHQDGGRPFDRVSGRGQEDRGHGGAQAAFRRLRQSRGRGRPAPGYRP